MFTGKERGAFTSKLSKVKETRNCSLLLKYWSFILVTNSGSTKYHQTTWGYLPMPPQNANDHIYLSLKKWSLTKKALSRNRGWESPSLCHEPSEFECRCHFEANAIVSIPCATFPVGGLHFATSNVTSCSPNIIVGECKRIPPFWLAVLGDTKLILCLHVKVHLHLLAFRLL